MSTLERALKLRVFLCVTLTVGLLTGCEDEGRPTAPSNPDQIAANAGAQAKPEEYLPPESFQAGKCTLRLDEASLRGGITGREVVGALIKPIPDGRWARDITALELNWYLRGPGTDMLPAECRQV